MLHRNPRFKPGKKYVILIRIDYRFQANLTKMLQECNSKLIEMEETKRASVSSKKVLAEQTRSFNKMTPEESLKGVQDLLKLYQVRCLDFPDFDRLG